MSLTLLTLHYHIQIFYIILEIFDLEVHHTKCKDLGDIVLVLLRPRLQTCTRDPFQLICDHIVLLVLCFERFEYDIYEPGPSEGSSY